MSDITVAVGRLLASHRLRYSNEAELQALIAELLASSGIEFEREVRLTPSDRIDFLLGCGLGIEVKLDNSLAALTRQLHRYAADDRILSLLVVTNLSRLTNLPAEMRGKPLKTILLRGGL